MTLLKIQDFDPNYSKVFRYKNMINYSVYSDVTDEKIGTVKNILVDEEDGSFRYLIIHKGFLMIGKQILLLIGLSQINPSDQDAQVEITLFLRDKVPNDTNYASVFEPDVPILDSCQAKNALLTTIYLCQQRLEISHAKKQQT